MITSIEMNITLVIRYYRELSEKKKEFYFHLRFLVIFFTILSK